MYVFSRSCKPVNVLLDRARENAKLTDFGISRLAQTLMSKSPTMNIGTPEYCAPEVFNPVPNGNAAGDVAKVDVYSFAVTLWETMAARKPFGECQNAMQIMFAVARGERPDVAVLPDSCSGPLRELLRRCWSAWPNERPTMRRVLEAIDPMAAEVQERAREAAKEERLCVVCWDREKSHILIPCGHLCVCEADSRGIRACPLCRAKVSSAHRVFH